MSRFIRQTTTKSGTLLTGLDTRFSPCVTGFYACVLRFGQLLRISAMFAGNTQCHIEIRQADY